MGSLLCCNEQGLRGRVAQWHLELLLYQWHCAARRFHMSHPSTVRWQPFRVGPRAVRGVPYRRAVGTIVCVAGQGLARRMLAALSSIVLSMYARQLRLSRARSGPRRTTDSGERPGVLSNRGPPLVVRSSPPHLPRTDPAFRPTLGHPTLALRRSGGGPALRPLFRIMMPSRQRFFMGMPIFRPLAIANRRARTGGLPTLRRLPANPASLGRCDAAIATE